MVILMDKKNWIIIVFITIIIIGFGIFFFVKNNNNTNENKTENNTENTSDTSYEANRISADFNNTTSNNSTNTSTETDKNNTNTQILENQTNSNTSGITEEQIATFSTKIYSQDSARQNNIAITCKALHGTTVKKGATFSFCQTVGPATSAKGYQEADIFDHNGKKKKGLGGGNCQISTTLYNAVLAVPTLSVTERHAHSNYVPYIQKGKDAAVAYGSYDFKFVNNTGNDIKIYVEASSSAITASLVSLKY